jgi:hypothetical protein
MGGKYSQSNFGSKGHRSNALDIEEEIRFLGSRTLPFPPRVTISHTWITYRRMMFPIKFVVKKSKVKRIGHLSSNMVSRLKNITVST